MRDRRRVDELSIEELERVLAMRKREERKQRLARMKRTGRIIEQQPVVEPAAPPPKIEPEPVQVQSVQDRIFEELAPQQKKPAKPALPIDPQETVTFVEDDGELPIEAAQPVKPSRRKKLSKAGKRMVNAALLLVEVAAVLGLVYLGWELFQGINILENRTAEAQQEIEAVRAAGVPTIIPTPMLSLNQIVLPGGHKFVEGQTPSLNIEEIPENVRFAVADQITRPVLNRPPATDETALRLSVPKLGIDQTIVQGADWEALKQGVGQVLNGYDPTDPNGNVALTAHNDIYGELFKDLDQLEPGDQFQIQTREDVFLYEITGTEIVKPTDVHVLNSTGKATAVLISCYPYRVNTQRIVVYADRVG